MRALPGSIVAVREREWIVLPSGLDDLIRLRPLTGSAADEAALLVPLEGTGVRQAEFPKPDPEALGDAAGLIGVLDAARLSLRSGAAPFRALGRISVIPRPYQFVPLLMALRLDPVRLLLADDVGVGKTIEAGFIARELLDRGIAERLAVLCPAHLCDQWHRELREKFALDADLIQPSTLARLERNLPRADVSVYQWPRCFVASIDFMKSPSQREAFLRHAPDLVIVDEAHGCAPPPDGRKAEHLRHELLADLMREKAPHLLLVTATPHSGLDESFRSLLGLLDSVLARPHPEGRAAERRRMRPHIVQRRRRDVERWLGTDTPFPEREPSEETYALGGEHLRLYEDVRAYCQELVAGGENMREAQRRVRHWAAIAMLRGVLSSPRAAEAVLSARARRREAAADNEAAEVVDGRYRPPMLDDLGDEGEGDYAPTGPLEDPDGGWSEREVRRLRELAKRAAALGGGADAKLATIVAVVDGLLRAGHRPIVFCRFIPTAKYLAEHIGRELGRSHEGLDARAVTGELGDEARRETVAELAASPVRVLVATDCLSEGINLQEQFDAVVHADLPWNPNRLEQREGRVDRFGQPRAKVRTVVVYGTNNEIDLVVLDVLIRKARKIHGALGVSVPVPMEAERVLDAVVGSVLLGRPGRAGQYRLDLKAGGTGELHAAWDGAVEREKEAQAYFRQSAIEPDEVAREIEATDDVLGDADAVRRFLAEVLPRFGGYLRADPKRAGVHALGLGELKGHLPPEHGQGGEAAVVFDRAHAVHALHLGRTHPIVAAAADAVLADAFEPEGEPRFARSGAMLTRAVARVTAVLLLRFRYTFIEEGENFAEEVRLVALQREGGRLVPLEPFDEARRLVERATPAGNFAPGDADKAERRRHVERVLASLDAEPGWWRPLVAWRVAELTAAHRRLRKITREGSFKVEAHPPPDVVACFVLVPAGGNGA